MGTVTDDFNRADGGLGANWDSSTAVDFVPAIASNKCIGVSALSNSGRTAEAFDGDHSSAFEVPGSLVSAHWVGVTVRRQADHGSSLYVGIYFFNDPSYVLQLYKRVGGTFTQLGSTFGLGTSPLAAGTILKLGVVGTTLDLSLDGVSKINLTDATYSGGHPGVMFAGGSDPVDNWIATGGPGHPTSQGVVIA